MLKRLNQSTVWLLKLLLVILFTLLTLDVLWGVASRYLLGGQASWSEEVARLLPEGSARFDEDTLTDRPLRYFAAEYVREPILKVTSQEVPHAVAITVERFSQRASGLVDIEATVHVERNGQKRIIIGEKGSGLKKIGSAARQRIEGLLERQVNLQLFVRVTPGWRERPASLSDFGLAIGTEELVAEPIDLDGIDLDGETS